MYGQNAIQIDVKPYINLFFEEVVNPFYIFQIFSMILWMFEQYIVYTACLLLMSLLSIGLSMYEIRQQSETLRDMVQSTVTQVEVVFRDGETRVVSSTSLVPGDLIVLPRSGCLLNCDCVLLNGSAVVNESMLTGESTSVAKLPIQADSLDVYDADTLKYKVHTLYSGTTILQAKSIIENEKVRALVVRTGFVTAKGALVRAILFPKPLGMKIYDDAFKFVGFLGAIAFAGVCYSIATLIAFDKPAGFVVMFSLDITTQAVPPALPAAMTVGMVYAVSRLKESKILCVSPNRINLAGKLKLVCFDKTGTMTQSDLDMYAAVRCDAQSQQITMHKSPLQFAEMDEAMLFVMAACHSISLIDEKLNGDPMELKIFQALDWYFGESPSSVNQEGLGLEMPFSTLIRDKELNPTVELGIIRPFPFIAELQCMSSIIMVRKANATKPGSLVALTKGAPEKIVSMSTPNSVPPNFRELLDYFTHQGLRVIACAWKPLDSSLNYSQVQKIARESVERDLNFLGFILLRNTLKAETKPTIELLNRADIRTVMLTGDNLLTACNIAQLSSMIPSREDRIVVVEHEFKPTPNPDHLLPLLRFLPFDRLRTDDQLTQKLGMDVHLDSETQSDVDNSTEDEKANMIQFDELKRTPTSNAYEPLGDEKYLEPRTHLALTGQTYSVVKEFFPELIPRFCVTATIFARMSPENKASIVEDLQNIDYCVAMCGDGANDSGALRRAHVGISLSEAEASVAAPFTSQITNITSVPIVIREGRCALVTSISVFKYMAAYSFIQYFSTLILFTLQGHEFPDMDYLYEDLFVTTVLVMLMGYTKPAKVIVARRPPSSLVSSQILVSIVAVLLIQAFFQVGSYFYLAAQQWYVPTPVLVSNIYNGSPESTIVWYSAACELLICVLSFSHGLPYRRPVFLNFPFICIYTGLIIFTTIIVMLASPALDGFFGISAFRSHEFFKVGFLALMLLDFVIVFVFDMVLIETVAFKKFIQFFTRKNKAKNMFKRIEEEIRLTQVPSHEAEKLKYDEDKQLSTDEILTKNTVPWPPIGCVVYSERRCFTGSPFDSSSKLSGLTATDE